MHPILLRIPLPHMPLKLWWGLVAVTVIAFAFAGLSLRSKDTTGALTSGAVGFAAGVGSYLARGVSFESPALPLYSYGVMLGLSLVVGWYLTLTLAKRDGLPQETMANCYVVTALAAIVGSRVLYVITNLDEFHSMADMFKVPSAASSRTAGSSGASSEAGRTSPRRGSASSRGPTSPCRASRRGS